MAKQQIFDRYMRDLEPEIQALARRAEPGELRQMYHARKSDRPIWIFGLISLIYGGIGLVLSVLAYFASSRRHFTLQNSRNSPQNPLTPFPESCILACCLPEGFPGM